MTMRTVLTYRQPDGSESIGAFLEELEPRLREKLLWQMFRLTTTPEPDMREPHVKHFKIEKYRRFYELREKNKVLVRIVFTIWNGDILLLVPFIKKQSRDTEQALERAEKAFSMIRAEPERLIKFDLLEEVRRMKSS